MQRYTIEDINSLKNKKEKNSRVRRIIIYILIIPLILYNVIILFQVFFYGNTTPDIFGYKTFGIISGSMTPTLNIGDIAVVKNLDKKIVKSMKFIIYSGII